MDFVKEYTDKINYRKNPLEYLKENKGFIKEKMENAKLVLQQYCYLAKTHRISFRVQEFDLSVMKVQKKNLELK